MSIISTLIESLKFNRVRTLATIDKIEADPRSQVLLAWRQSPGRAHIAWQLMHIGITEELFATERLTSKKPQYTDLVPRFKGGSTPDDNIPSLAEIRKILSESRDHLIATLSEMNESQLSVVSEGLKERKLTLLDAIHILIWHEAHHQGQVHYAMNSFPAANP